MAIEDVVRPFQLPTPSAAVLNLNEYNLATNAPIYVTPGFGGSASSNLPPIQTGAGHLSRTITFYMDQAAVEQAVEQ